MRLKALFLAVIIPSLLQAADGNNVLVVINENMKESVEVGEYYAQKRNVPAANICRIKCSSSNSTDITTYKKQILEPVLRSVNGGIKYIAMTYGTPYILSINGGTYSLDAFLCFPNETISENIVQLKASGTGLSGYAGVSNPYYDKGSNFSGGGRSFLVTRLDGPTPEIAKELVDRALYGEKFITTKYGKAVFDARGIKAPSGYYSSDQDIIEGGNISKAKGYDTFIDLNEVELSNKCSPNTLWYFGWYSYNHYNDAFTWKVGAVGIHFDSASAASIRGGPCWVAQALLRGITATGGAVAEPYTTHYIRANLFYKYFLNGYNFAEACYLATPTSKWMMCYVGDPLYNPSSGEKKIDNVKPSLLKIEFEKNDDSPDKAVELILTTDKFADISVEYGTEKNKLSGLAGSEVMKIKHNLDVWDLEPATKYYFKITCLDSSGNSSSKEVEYTTAALSPAPVEGLEAEKLNGELRLTWERSAGSDLAGYRLYKKEMGAKVYGAPLELTAGSVSYEDKGLVNEKTYVYCLRVVNKTGSMSAKKELYAALTELVAVTNLRAEQNLNGIKVS
ncbi:MAG: TIGR03790 family protein, partial [Candidatus Firestonebacteria bacterium]